MAWTPGCRAERDRLKKMGMKGRAWMGRDFSWDQYHA